MWTMNQGPYPPSQVYCGSTWKTRELGYNTFYSFTGRYKRRQELTNYQLVHSLHHPAGRVDSFETGNIWPKPLPPDLV